ncbi:MAG: ATP synthase F1 subunit delta [Gammaproteobacteria bacterium RIFCSPHIGHO2_12_FULL_38_14]|nr:MAG: ATP synthase F1 subunit delta [Gammaproteobacteria bacterium RIFCSPHIGHO2_12_FULL_38_14]
MSNLTHIARPYALAAFEYARFSSQLLSWKAFLQSASTITKDKTIQKLLDDPQIDQQLLFDLFHGVLASIINDEQKNFLLLLQQYKRFALLPGISELFDTYYAAFEKMQTVRVVTAIQMEKEIQQKLSQALTKRMQHEVILHCEVDPHILGGAVIHIGDHVIDGSIRGKLSRLLEFSLR